MTPLALLVLIGAAAAGGAPGSGSAPFGGPCVVGILGRLPGARAYSRAMIYPWIAGAYPVAVPRAASGPQKPILKNDSVNNGNGSSASEYATANGIRTGEAGVQNNAEEPGAKAEPVPRSYTYIDDAGKNITVYHIVNGGQLPTRPSINEATFRLLKPYAVEEAAAVRYPEAGAPGVGYLGDGFPGAGYPGAGFPGAVFPGAVFPGAWFSGADFQGAYGALLPFLEAARLRRQDRILVPQTWLINNL
ncbi:pupal cuticle protein 20-like [Bacillus rossius redtenbacheri]|uniref:pupal cuticle protein 20-like n=1 Tax=Bacillus rossius redtenbacheri TaxID=93214 RepID=UPI002FDE8352